MAKGNVNPNPSPNPAANPAANPPPSAPPTSTGTGGGPTGNSGYSMSDSSMQGLQNKAGDLGSRLASISSGLRGLNFSGNALGPIGLFAVPALNASNDNAIAQADRGAKAFTDVQSGLKATHQTSTTTDTSQGSNFRSIDPSTNAKPPPGATAPPPGLNTSGGKVTGPESIKGGGNFTPGLNAQGGPKHTGPQAVKGGGNFTPGLNAQGGPKATGPDAIKGGGANPGSNLNTQGGGGKVNPAQGPKGGGAGFTPSLGPAPGGGKVGDVQGPKGGGANPGSTLNPQGGGGKVSPTQGPKGGAGFTPSLGPAPAGGGKVSPTQGPKGGAGFTPSLGPAPASGGKVNPTQGPKGGGAGFTPSLGPAPAGGKVNPTQGPKGGAASFTPSLGKAPGGPAAGAPPVVGGTPGAPGTPGSKGGGAPGGGGKVGGVPTVPGSGATPGATPGSTPGQVAGTKPSATPPGPQGAVPPRGATPPAMSPGMAPPMAPGATPGATGGERGGSKFGTGPGKGVFDAPKPGTPDSTITKAPPSSTSTPPPAPKPTIPGTPGTPGSPTTPGGTPGGTSAGSGAPKPGGVPGAVPGSTTPTTPGSQSAVATPPQSAGPRGGAAPAVTPPPAASPGMAPPMAPGATPGATGGERGGNKFGPGGAKGVFDAPKAPTPDNTITKAPGTSPSTPPPAPKPTPLTPQPNTNVPPAASAPTAPPQSRPGTPPPVSTPPVSSPNTAPPAQTPAATAPPQSRPGTPPPVSTPPVATPTPTPNTNVPPSRTDTPPPAQTPRSDTPPAQTRPAPPTTVPPATVPPANAPSPAPATNVPPANTPNTNTPPPRTDTPPPAQTPRSDTPPAQTRPAPPTTVPPATVPPVNAPSPAPNVTAPPANTPPAATSPNPATNVPPATTPSSRPETNAPAASTPPPRPETSVPPAQPKPEPQANPRPETTAPPAQTKPTPDTPAQTRPAPPVAPPPANVPPVTTPTPAPAATVPPANTPNTNTPPVNTPAPAANTPPVNTPNTTTPSPTPATNVPPTTPNPGNTPNPGDSAVKTRPAPPPPGSPSATPTPAPNTTADPNLVAVPPAVPPSRNPANNQGPRSGNNTDSDTNSDSESVYEDAVDFQTTQQRVDSYRAEDPTNDSGWQQDENGGLAFGPNKPSEFVGIRVDENTTVGLTPYMVKQWLADNGIRVPKGTTVESAIHPLLYDANLGGGNRKPEIYGIDNAADFHSEMMGIAAEQDIQEQQHVLDAVNDLATDITGKYPPDQFSYVGLGRSPAAVVAALQNQGHDAVSIPLSNFRPLPSDPNSILIPAYNGPDGKPKTEPLTDQQQDMLDQHFDEFLGDLPPGKNVLLIDYTQGGLSLVSAQYQLQQHLNQNATPDAPPPRVQAFAIHEATNRNDINKTINAAALPGSRFQGLYESFLDGSGRRNSRQDFRNNIETHEIPFRHPLGDAFRKEAFDEFSEHGSYKILEQNPDTFQQDRPHRNSSIASNFTTAYEVLKDAVGEGRPKPTPDTADNGKGSGSRDDDAKGGTRGAPPSSSTGTPDTNTDGKSSTDTDTASNTNAPNQNSPQNTDGDNRPTPTRDAPATSPAPPASVPPPPAPPAPPAPSSNTKPDGTRKDVPKVGAPPASSPPAMTPPTPESHRGKDVLSDESWRHDPAKTADWSNPDNPADRSTWVDRRNDTDVRTVDLDVRDVRTDSTPSKIKAYKGLINYDLRRIETSPGKFVQEYTVKVHLEPTGKTTPDELAQIRDNASNGVNTLLNQGFRLPSGDQFHVNLEFTDNKADAHTTVKVDPKNPNVDQDHWNPDTSPEVLAHETLHYLGVPDEYKDTTRVLQQHETNSGVHQNDDGLMGSSAHLPDPGIRPRHLWLIERTANSQVMVPDTTIDPPGPATVPPPAGWTPKPPTNDGPVSTPGTDGVDSDPSPDADLPTRPATMPGRFFDSDSDSNSDIDVAVRPNQTHLPNLDRVGLVESVLRSAAFQNAPVPNASPLVGSNDVRSTVDTVLNDVRQNPQNHNHPGLTPPALATWVANQVSPDALAKFHPDLEPNTPGLTPDAKTQQWRANLADDLANGSSRRWDVVNAGPKAAGTNPGNVEVINHLTQQLNANGALPSPADLVAKALETPSWADSHVGSHLPDSIAQALDVQLVVDDNGVQTVHGPDGATQVQISSQNGTFGALGAPSVQEVRAGMEAWLAGKSSAEVNQTIADLYKGRQDEGLYQAAQKVQLVKRAAAHPGGPQAFVNALRERASTLENRIAEVRSQAPRRRSSLWRNPQHDAKRAQIDAQVKTLTDLLDSTNSQIETLAAQGPGLGTTHLIDKFVAGPNADKLEHLPADVLPRLDDQLTAQITAAENAGFDASDLKKLQERVRNEADVRTVLNHASTRGLDGLTSQVDDAREALQNYRAGKATNTGFQGFLNQMLGQEVDTSVDFDQKIAQAETLVQQAERNLALTNDPDYSNRFDKAAEKYAKLQAAMQRLEQLNAEIDARAERLRDLEARTREFNARQLARALEEHRTQRDTASIYSTPGFDTQSDVDAQSDADARSDADAQSDVDARPDSRVLTPRHEHAAFRASLYGKSQAELAELAEQHSTHPDRSFEIEQMARYQEIAHKQGGLQQHLRDLQNEIRQTREDVRDLRRTTDALPDVFKTELMRTDQAQRWAEQQRLIDHARGLDQELMRLQYDRTDALTTYALTLPTDTTAPEWQTVTPVDAEIIENRVTDLIRDARIGGLPTPELDRLYDQIREIRMMETPSPSRHETPVPSRPETPTADVDDSASIHSDDSTSTDSDTDAPDHDTAPPAGARQEQVAPAAEPGPFMQDPSSRSAGPDMDLVVPGGFGPVHEGTPQRSFEASLYGLDTAALRNLQQTYGRDAARSAAIEHMIEVSRQAGPPAVHDQRTRIAEQRLDEMKTARDRWNASDIVPDRLKTQAMLDEQANRRAAADRQVEYYQQRVDQLTNNRDAALTTHALQLPADVNAPAWRQFGDADLAAVRSHVDQQIRDAQAGGHNTAHLEAFLDFTNELQETRQNEDADTRPAPEPETRPAPPKPTPNPVIPMTTMAPQPVGQLPDTNLPSFFQDNKALGSIVPTDVRGADAVVREINGLRPDDAARIKNAIENDFETFLGDGRNFQVKIGNAWFEANVRAEMHADGSSTTDAANTKVDKNYQAAAASTTTNSISTSNDVGGAVTAGVAMGPYGSLGGKAALATPAVSQATSTSITEQRAIKGSDSGSKKITVPVSYEITLYDASGNPSLFSTLSTGPDVTLQVPTDLTTIVDSGKSSAAVTPPDAAWGLKAENAVPEAVVVKDSGKLFNDVAENLHPSITKIGSPGREALQNFLSPTSIRNNLPAMLGGFVTSPDLISPHASKGAAVQMKATLKDAKLVGTHADAALDLKDTFSWGSSVSASSKTGFDVTAGFGGNIGVPGKVGGTVGATGGYSARTAEGVNAGTSSSRKSGIGVKAETGLYEVTAEVEVQGPAGKPVTMEITTHMRMGVGEAGAVGLPTPVGTRNSTTDPATADTRFLPPYVADTLAAGNAKVGEFVPATQVQHQVETKLRELPGFEKFLPKWTNPDANPRSGKGQGFGDVAVQLANQRKLDANLSPAALKANMDSLLGPGVQVQLKNSGKTTNTYVNVTVKAKLTNPKHLGKAEGRPVSDSTTSGPKLDANTSTTKGWTGGITGRANIPVKTGVASLTPMPQAGVSYSHSWTDKTSAGPAVSATSSNPGSPDAQVFQGDVEFEVEITTFTRPRTWVRTVVPGAPGRHAPDVKTVAKTGAGLDKIDGKVNLWVSDSSTLKDDPGDGFKPGDPSATPLENSPTVKDLLNPAQARPKSPEFLHVEAVANTTELRDQAIDALNRAAKGDSALTTPGTASRAQIDKMFAPENIKANLQRLIETGVQEQGLKYDRRVADRSGAIGMSVKLGGAKLVSISDATGTDNSVSGGYKAGGSSTTSRSVDLVAGINVPVRPNVTPPPAGQPSNPSGSGGVAVTGKWTPWSDNKTTSNEIGGNVDRGRTTPDDARTVLVQVDAEFTIVGESRAENFVHGGTPNAEGVKVNLPKSVFVRVSEDVAREMGVLPRVAPNVPKPDFPKMAPPSTVAPGEPGALGLSNVEKVPDLSAAVNELTTKLSTNTKKFGSDALIPDSVLKDSMSNLQRIVDLNSPSSVKAMIDSALDGGVPLLVHQPGTFGKDSYQVTLRAKTGEPKFDQVVNDGVDMSHNDGGSRKESDGKGRGTGWGLGLRAPGLASPGSANPNVSGTAGLSVIANVGSAQSSSVTASTSTAFGHNRTASGPAARYNVPVEFELVVEKGDKEVAKVRSAEQDMVVRTHADNQKVSEPTTGRGTPQPYMSAASRRGSEFGTPEATYAFQQDSRATQLSATASVENLRGAGDLRNAAVKAMTEAGAGKGLTGKGTGSLNSLLSTLSPENLQPHLPAMLSGPLDVPGLKEAALTFGQDADVKVYAKLVNPQLGSLSDGVKIETPLTTKTTDVSSEAKVADTSDVAVGLAQGSAAVKQGDPRDTVNVGTGGVELKHANEDSSAVSGGPAQAQGGSVKPKDPSRTGLVQFDVEYRVVATIGGKTGVVDLTVPGSAGVRMPATEVETMLNQTFSDSLKDAQTEVKKTADDWREAEKKVDEARHEAQEVINSAAAVLARTDQPLGDAATKLNTAIENHVNAEAELRTRQTAFDTAVADVARTRAAIQDLTPRISSLSQDALATKDALDDAQIGGAPKAELDRLGQEADAAHTALTNAQQQLTDAHTQLDVQRKTAVDARAELQAQQKAVADAETARTDAEKAHQALTEERAAAENKIKDAETKLDDARRAADAEQKKWWDAKAEADRQVDLYNATPPPATPPPAPPAPPVTPGDATTNTPARDATTNAPPADATTSTPARDAATNTPAGNATTNTPPADATTNTPPADATTNTPPADATTNTPPRDTTSTAADVSQQPLPSLPAESSVAESSRSGAETNSPSPAPETTKAPKKVRGGGAPPAMTPPTPESHRGKDVLSDESWRHDPARTADWSNPDNPADRSTWAHRRNDTDVRTVDLDVRDVRTDSTPSKIKAYKGLINYDLRRIETSPGKFVQEYTVKVHLEPTGKVTADQLAQIRDNATNGVNTLLNQGFRLPSGDQFHLNLEFTDNKADAHTTVKVDPNDPKVNQDHWNPDTSPEVLAHETLHYLGVPDEYKDTTRVLQQHETNSGVHDNDGGLMDNAAHLPDPGIRPRHLWLIERTANSQVMVPDTTINPPGPATVPPPAVTTPSSGAAPHGVPAPGPNAAPGTGAVPPSSPEPAAVTPSTRLRSASWPLPRTHQAAQQFQARPAPEGHRRESVKSRRESTKSRRESIKKLFTVDVPGMFRRESQASVPFTAPAAAVTLTSSDPWVGLLHAQADPSTVDVDVLKDHVAQAVAEGKPGKARILINRLRGSDKQAEVQQHYDDAVAARGDEGAVEVPKELHFAWFGTTPNEAAVQTLLRWAAKVRENNENSTSPGQNWKATLWTDASSAGWAPEVKQQLADAGIDIQPDIDSLVHDLSTDVQSRTDTRTTIDDVYSAAKDPNAKAYNLQSDIARYAVLAKRGGVYVDVDIRPGAVSLIEVGDLKMQPTDVPLMAPRLRDQHSVDNALAGLEDVAPGAALSTAAEIQYDKGELNNNFIVAPPGNDFIHALTDVIPKKFEGLQSYGMSQEAFSKALKKQAPDISGPNVLVDGGLTPTTGLIGQFTMQPENHGLRVETNYLPEPVPLVDKRDYSALFDPKVKNSWSGLEWVTTESEAQIDTGSSQASLRAANIPNADVTAAATARAETTPDVHVRSRSPLVPNDAATPVTTPADVPADVTAAADVTADVTADVAADTEPAHGTTARGQHDNPTRHELTEQIAAMGLDARHATSTFDDLSALGSVENHVADVLSSPGVQGPVNRILSASGSLSPEHAGRVRDLVTDLLVTTSAVPVRHRRVGDITKLNLGHVHDWQTARPLPPATLEHVLDEIAADVEAGRVPLSDLPHNAADPLPRRLAVLGTLNLAPHARAGLLAHPPFTALLDSPHLADALFAGKGLDEQRFLNTCESAAVHTGLRSVLPTVIAQVHAGRAVADSAEWALLSALENSPELLARKDRPGGRTVEQLVRDRIAEARETFDRLEQQSSTDAPDWAAMSDDWGRVMQKLAAVSDPSEGVDSIPVLSRKAIRGAWAASAVLSLPLGVDRPGRRGIGVNEDYRLLAEQVLADPTPSGRTKPLADIVDDRFWSRVHHAGVLPVALEGRFTAHALSVQAVRHEGVEVYLVGDPKKKHFDMLTQSEFAAWAARSNAEAALPLQTTVITGPANVQPAAPGGPAHPPTGPTPPEPPTGSGPPVWSTTNWTPPETPAPDTTTASRHDGAAEQQREITTAAAGDGARPKQGRPADVLDWARRMPLVDLAMTDPGAKIRQGQSTREHTQRVLEVLGRPAPRSFPGIGRILPKITAVTAQGPEAATRNDAVALASVVDNVARDMAEAFNDPLLKPVFARKIIESQADRLHWDGDASSSSMSPEAVRLAGALVSDDPLTSFMRGDVELPAVAARVESLAQRAGLDAQTTFDLLRRRYEAEMLSYTMSEIQAGRLRPDRNANGSFELEALPGEIAPSYFLDVVELRKTAALQHFFSGPGRGEPEAREWNNKDLVLTKTAAQRLDDLRAVLAPTPATAAAEVPAADVTAPAAGPWTPPAALPFTAADLAAGRDGLASSATSTSVPPPGSAQAGSLTQRQYEHLRDIRTGRSEGDQALAAAAARRESVKQNLVEKLSVPDLAAAEQVLAKAEEWFATAPITISLKGETVFGTDQGAAALTQPDARYLPAAEIGLRVVDPAALEALRSKKSNVDAHRAEADRLADELLQKAQTEDSFRPSPEFKALRAAHYHAKTVLTASELDAARTPRQVRYLEGLLAEDPDFAFWTLSNEVNVARGDNYTRWRREKDDAESGRRGFGPHEAAVFGAVNVNYDRTKGFEGTAGYGDTHLLLEPHVRQRSYYTFGTRGPARSNIVDLMHDMFEQNHTEYVNGIVQNALGLEGMIPQRNLLLETHVYGDVVFGRDVAEVSVPRAGLDPAVRARIEAFAETHGIALAEWDPAAWPEQKAEVDAAAVGSALAAPPADQDATDASRAGGAGERTTSGQPVAAPQLPEPGLGRPFVEDLFDEIDAKTSAAPRPADLRDSVRWRVPEDAASLTPDRLEQEFGIPKVNQERFQNFVDRFNIVLDVRPTNPDSVRWLHDGAMPKPKDIKAKTINQADVLLGADAEHVGLVGFFQPDPNPDLSGVDPAMRDKVARRFNERAAEFAELIGTMEKYEQEGKFKVIDGVVHGANSRGDLVWVTGDADMYGMYDTEGNRLREEDYEGMVFLLVNRNVGVQHGAHLYWDPVTDFDRKIFDTIVNKHVTEEPLVRFSPGQPASLVLADPLPPRVDADNQAAPVESGSSERHEVAEAAPPSRLSQYEEHVSSTRRHLRHLAFDVLNRPAPPPVTSDGLYAAVGEVVRQDPAALRAQVLNHAATTAAVSQATADFTASRPVHTGHLTGALVENANWRMHADANENAGAGNARDLLGHLIATRLGTTLVVHRGTGAAPLVLAPMGDHAGVPVEVDMVVVDGRVTYRPHQPLQRGV
ncbi:glycosyltransferase [Lentzea sp. DG1S-22]|uniref:glycosyltransferase n=1 Tax=Lentzea sp. DG1S-22 TaxID=3108822 RepID=UPI002E7A25E0|nr:glycosyltransferase [Lentzea sp. DG1S-22]WVH83346.1 glycosyltransferase [Lentzea sp. DG1S-22]